MHSFYNQNCYGSNGNDPFCEPALATSVSLSTHVQTSLLQLNASAQSGQEPGLSGSSFGFARSVAADRKRADSGDKIVVAQLREFPEENCLGSNNTEQDKSKSNLQRFKLYIEISLSVVYNLIWFSGVLPSFPWPCILSRAILFSKNLTCFFNFYEMRRPKLNQKPTLKLHSYKAQYRLLVVKNKDENVKNQSTCW